jgi:class 3 adenylate cyclase/predicted ATPase
MRCPRCDADTPDGAKFCIECGTPLRVRCPQCGADMLPRAKFCGECGTPLTGQSSPPLAAPPPSPLSYTPGYLAEKILTTKTGLEGERKQVTVLFADLKSSMELLADRDPEEARQLLDPVLDRMIAAVHRYEGTVNQVMGDGIMALFGAPIAHEDHAVRACFAALAMQTAIRSYAEEVRRGHGIAVQIRVGLNSGEVVVRAIGNDLHMDYSAIGQTTHLAARMEQLATPGSILLTAETLRLVEGLVQVTVLGPVPVKGLAAPVEVFELIGAESTRRRSQGAAARGLTRFVGRQHELETLRQALEQAEAGHGQVVAVIGEPGVGKTRLFYEFTRSPRTHGWLLLESNAVSYGKATPYLPMRDLLKAYFQIDERDEGRKIREKVTGKLVTLDTALGTTLPAFLELLDVPAEDPHWKALDPPQRRQRTLQAVKHLLPRESQVQPVLLVFESLHWIDAETQALLDSLVESLPTARLLLLVNYRPEYQHSWGNRTYYTQLRLDPLPRDSAQELLDALLGDDIELAPLKQRLIDRTEGNPFFLEESVQTLFETEALIGERGAYRLGKALPTIQVPATVQAVLAARIDRLMPEDKRLLQAAAVIGTDVPYTLLHSLAAVPEEDLRHGLSRLQGAEFLYEMRLFPDLAYTFKHALTYEVAYNSLLIERRQGLHERVAQAIEALFHDRIEEHYSELAHHYSCSGNTAKAVAYCQRAGQQAVRRSAFAEAITILTTGLEVLKALPYTPERTRQELDLQTSLGPALMATQGITSPEVEQTYTRARELCRQVGETPQLFPVLGGLRAFYEVRGELQIALELGEQLLSLAQHAHDPAHLLEAHMGLGSTLFWLGEMIPARAQLEQGITLDDAQPRRAAVLSNQSDDPGVTCRRYAAWTLWWLGYPDQALQQSLEARTLAQELSHPYSMASALYNAAVLHCLRREAQIAQRQAEAVVELSREQGFAQRLATGTILRGWALAEQGQRDEGMAQMRQGLDAYRATGAELLRPLVLALLAEGHQVGGQAKEGLMALDEALAMVHKTGALFYEAELYRLRGELLLKQTAVRSDAEACFRQALDIARRRGANALELRAAMSLSRLWQQQGKRDAARELLAPIYGWFTEGFDTVDLQEAKALLGELS